MGGGGKGKNKLLGNRTESLYLYHKCNKRDGKVKESGEDSVTSSCTEHGVLGVMRNVDESHQRENGR